MCLTDVASLTRHSLHSSDSDDLPVGVVCRVSKQDAVRIIYPPPPVHHHAAHTVAHHIPAKKSCVRYDTMQEILSRCDRQ